MGPLDELRALYDQAGQTDTKDLGIPASRGRLVVRYAPPRDREQLAAVMRAVGAGTVIEDDADVDLIVNCAQDILRRDGDDLVPLAEDGRPVRFDKDDPRLGQALGFTYDSAREAALKTFKADKFPLSITGHFESLVTWLQGFDEAGRELVEGKSEAASAA